jgi:CRISPR system Cascade subunit CasE
MYLSQCELDRKAIHNTYEQHRILWKHFPDDPDAERPFLYRLEHTAKSSITQPVMMLSIKEPQDSSIHSKIVASKPFEPIFRQGQILRFLLEANPIKRLSDSHKRVPLIDEEAQIKWLEKKLAPAAQLCQSLVTARKNLFFRRKGLAGKIVQVRFEGILEVNNPEGLRTLIEAGIGPAKSFGCGLLLIRRV